MAQLSDDCFAFGGTLLSVDAALRLIDQRLSPVVDHESVPLVAAAGRILARDIVASIDVPPHANSAVDGYALAHADLAAEADTVLPIAGRAKQIVRIIVIIIGVLSLLKYLAIY